MASSETSQSGSMVFSKKVNQGSVGQGLRLSCEMCLIFRKCAHLNGKNVKEKYSL